MTTPKHPVPNWVTRGKTIRQINSELQSFEDQDMDVRMSLDDGNSHRCISIVQRHGDYCVLVNSENYHHGEWQTFVNEQGG